MSDIFLIEPKVNLILVICLKLMPLKYIKQIDIFAINNILIEF